MAQSAQTSNTAGPMSHRQPPPPPPPRPPSRRQIRKVPNVLLMDGDNHSCYDPKVVSIGPYHHGEQELGLAESFKPMALKMVVSDKQDLYYRNIRRDIVRIRNSYEQDSSTDSHSDDELARMMLLDACFIIIHIETSLIQGRRRSPKSEREIRMADNAASMFEQLGRLNMSIVLHDMFLLENQIPLWIVKLLLRSRYNESETKELLYRYLRMSLFREFRPKRRPPPQKTGELHLLEAFQRVLVGSVDQPKKSRCRSIKLYCRLVFCCFRAKETDSYYPDSDQESGVSSIDKNCTLFCCFKVRNRLDHQVELVHSFRSVTDLKAKGIYLKPSPTKHLVDVRFKPKCISAELKLPSWYAFPDAKVFFLNMITYEFSADNIIKGVVTSYINFMKSLIVRPEDVKELREKKILLGLAGSDEEILKVYRDINTYEGVYDQEIFQQVKDEIQAHCNSRAKTWIAELIHTYFRRPWTFITLLAAACLLVLTTLQTIYTMKS